jgi:hypothetical protein
MSVIAFDSALLDELAGTYKLCGQATQGAIDTLKMINPKLDENYTGVGESIARDGIEKTIEHLELFLLCVEQSEAYVDYTKSVAETEDGKAARIFRGFSGRGGLHTGGIYP